MTIGIRELKANLSKCLKRVQAGEQLTVTDRGRAIATISPVKTPANVEWAWRMVARGEAYWSGGKPTGLAKPISSRGGKPASQMVLEDRR